MVRARPRMKLRSHLSPRMKLRLRLSQSARRSAPCGQRGARRRSCRRRYSTSRPSRTSSPPHPTPPLPTVAPTRVPTVHVLPPSLAGLCERPRARLGRQKDVKVRAPRILTPRRPQRAPGAWLTRLPRAPGQATPQLPRPRASRRGTPPPPPPLRFAHIGFLSLSVSCPCG